MTINNQDDFVRHRVQKAEATIAEIDSLIEKKFWNTAFKRIYYPCFYVVIALLIKNSIKTTTHSGTRQQFGRLFIHTGKLDLALGKHYNKLFEKRQRGDYEDFFDAAEKTVVGFYAPSKEFIKQVIALVNAPLK